MYSYTNPWDRESPLYMAVTRRVQKKAWCEVRCEDLIFRMQAPVSHVHITSGHERTHHPMKSEPYSHRTSHRVLLKSRVTVSNGAIQRTRPVPRACSAIQLYSARVYSCAIQHTAYTLYSPIRRSSGHTSSERTVLDVQCTRYWSTTRSTSTSNLL